MSDLMKQIQDECSIDDKSGFETAGNLGINTEDIKERLDKLKGREPKAKSSGQSFLFFSQYNEPKRIKKVQCTVVIYKSIYSYLICRF